MASDTLTRLDGGNRSAPPALLTKGLIRKHFVPIGTRTLDRWISQGQFPRPDIALGGKVRFWTRDTVEAWMNAQVEGGRHER